MNRPLQINVQGSLYLRLDQDLIKIECEGRCIKVIFSSFKILKKFFYCHQNFKKYIYPYLTQHALSQLDMKYYLVNKLIGESNPNLIPSWLGKYLGIEKSKFYPSTFLSYFFSLKNN